MSTNTPLYSVATYDFDSSRYTPQRGLSVRSFNIPLPELRQALRELKAMGYSAHRRRDAGGSYDDNDSSVLVERTDGACWRSIMRGWDRWPYIDSRSERRARLREEAA